MGTRSMQWGERYLAAMQWCVPPVLQGQPAQLTRAQNVINAALLAAASGPLYALAYQVLGFPVAAGNILLCCLAMLAAPLVLRLTGSIVAARELFLCAVFVNFSWLSYHLGGVSSPTAAWLVTTPVVALFLGGVVTALAWLAMSSAAIAVLYALQAGGMLQPATRVADLPLLQLICTVGLFVVVAVFVMLFELTKTQGFVRLEAALRTINELAIRDELTGVHNRRHLLRLIERESARGQRFSLCLLDIDFFKRINDTYGHLAGDAVLRQLAATVQAHVRPGDCFGRYGGEEFLLMMPGTHAAGALVLAERVRAAIEELRCAEIAYTVALTVSIGVCEYRPGESISQAVGRADEALYLAKSSGRNRVVCHGDTAPALHGQSAPDAPVMGASIARLLDGAHADLLTGLLNRRMLRDRLQHAMDRARRNGAPLALMLFNIHKFRDVNESFGVEAGDAVLTRTAAILRGALRDCDSIARWGGDEFIAVLEDVGGEAEARQVGEKILERFVAPLAIATSGVAPPGVATPGADCFIQLNIGIALYPAPEADLDALLRRAEQALARARGAGANSIEVVSASGPAPQSERLALKNGLRTALAAGQLFIEYQPQVDLLTRRVVGVEALLRWQHPQYGRIAPSRFIALAEETGMIVPIGEWALRTACLQNRAWRDAGLPPIKTAVNLSARQLKEPGLAARVLAIVAETGIAPRCLDVEITESVLIEDLAHNRATLAALRAAGIQVSIDDFGTGYSSLNYLSELPVDILKMDGLFVRRLGAGRERPYAIAEAIVSIAHKLKLTVIAEAVETEAQHEDLVALGCDQAQGFLFHRPLHPDAIATLLTTKPRLVAA